MFKSRIPLQTPIVVKLLLFTALVAFFTGWSVSGETSSNLRKDERKAVNEKSLITQEKADPALEKIKTVATYKEN